MNFRNFMYQCRVGCKWRNLVHWVEVDPKNTQQLQFHGKYRKYIKDFPLNLDWIE